MRRDKAWQMGPLGRRSSRGEYPLPERAEAVFGPEHPHGPEVARDLVRLCRHPDAGDLILSGWSRGKTPLSFVVENGAHGGPGPEETSAFVILPPQVGPDDSNEVLGVAVLRQAVADCLGRGTG